MRGVRRPRLVGRLLGRGRSRLPGGRWAVSPEPLPDLPRLPDPAGKSAAEYRECLPVPPLNPYAPLESLPLFYLIPDDLLLLHRLLQFGIGTMGRWRDLRQTGRAQLGLEPGKAEALDAWASVAEAFWEAWHIGRGLPLTRQALLDGGVSGTFIAPVWALAQECGGDARALMERLRAKSVARFRAEACSRLDDYLREQGYLCPDDPLDEEGICIRVLNGADIGPLAPETVRIRVHELCAEASRFMPLG